MNARLYDPALGRFLSPDPYVQAPDFSQSFNRYSYCLNNPLRYGDPTGEYAVIDDIISMALGGIYNVVTNWGNINSIGQGFAFFGVGVVGGAVSLYGSPLAGAAVLSVGNNVLSQGFSKGWDNINFDQVAIAGVMGVATSYLGGQVGGVLSKPIDKLTSGIASPVLRDMATQSLTNGGTGFVLSTSLSLGSGSSFEDAISAGGQSALTGLGIGATNGTISGFRYAHENNLNPWDGLSNERPTMQRLSTPDIGGQSKPLQVHHFATNKNQTFTPQMQKIANKYELDLDGNWNKARLPHIGRHPNDYHEWVLDKMNTISNMPNMNQQNFVIQYNRMVINPVLQNPSMLNKIYWKP